MTNTRWAFSRPAKLPGDMVQQLNREINQALGSDRVRKKLEHEAIETEMSPEQFTRFIASEIAKWGPLAKAAILPRRSGN